MTQRGKKKQKKKFMMFVDGRYKCHFMCVGMFALCSGPMNVFCRSIITLKP